MMVMPQFEGEEAKAREASPIRAEEQSRGSQEQRRGSQEQRRGSQEQPGGGKGDYGNRPTDRGAARNAHALSGSKTEQRSPQLKGRRDVEDPNDDSQSRASQDSGTETVAMPTARRNSIAWEDMKSAVRRMSMRTSIIRTMAAQEEMDILKGASQFMIMD